MFSQAYVILSTGGGGVWQIPPWADTPGQIPPPPGRHLPRQTPAPPQQTATAADGTHSTGMHSCLVWC